MSVILFGATGIAGQGVLMSGDPAQSPEHVDLAERLRAAADLVSVLARDHVIVAAGGRCSFVAAGSGYPQRCSSSTFPSGSRA